MKKQYASFICAIIVTLISSSSYAADDHNDQFISNTLNAMQQTYGGFLGSMLTHNQKAAVCGLVSLYITPKIGSYVGGALGIGTGAVLSSVTNRDPATGILVIGSGGVLGGVLGYIAGIPTSYMLYSFLANRWVRQADECIDNYARNHLTPDHRTRLLNHINQSNSGYLIQNSVFQGNEDSYRKFRSILGPQVVQ